jgi:antitoxin HigA-1
MMKHPPHPGEGLKDDLEALGLTVLEAAKGLGVTRQQLNNILSGRSRITPEMALRLEKGIGSSADHWLRLQNAYDLSVMRDKMSSFHIARFVTKVA